MILFLKNGKCYPCIYVHNADLIFTVGIKEVCVGVGGVVGGPVFRADCDIRTGPEHDYKAYAGFCSVGGGRGKGDSQIK